MIYKGREREHRGRLVNFYDLPELVQTIFINIKKEINNELKQTLDVYVYGSYLHGYWDDKSDYDIAINENCNNLLINQKISDKLGIKVDIFCSEQINNMILIP